MPLEPGPELLIFEPELLSGDRDRTLSAKLHFLAAPETPVIATHTVSQLVLKSRGRLGCGPVVKVVALDLLNFKFGFGVTGGALLQMVLVLVHVGGDPLALEAPQRQVLAKVLHLGAVLVRSQLVELFVLDSLLTLWRENTFEL